MSNKSSQQVGSDPPGEDPPFCVRQFAMITFQEYSCRPHGADAEPWLSERFGS